MDTTVGPLAKTSPGNKRVQAESKVLGWSFNMWLIIVAALAGTPFDGEEPELALENWVQPYRLQADPASVTAGSAQVEAMIIEADRFLGEKWIWNGRNTEKYPGVDCLGLLFLAHGKVVKRQWYDYAYDPSPLVKSGKLGAPVPGLDGVLRGNEDRSLLRRGDILYFLLEGYVVDDEPLLTLGNDKYWAWHTGIYVGEGQHWVLNAHPSYGTVRMVLDDISWDALLVTRPFP